MADIRSTSVDYKRESENKAKWARGEAWGPGRSKDAHGAPVRIKPKFPRTNQEGGVRNAKDAQRHDIIASKAYASGDSSCDEEPVEPTAAPAPDAEIAYSFDADKGPTQGSTVLTQALAKAVERFESNMTDKLVKEEYEILNSDGEFVTTSKKGGKRTVVREPEEEDYEFV
ncbi:hypothetical protein EJ08DRAFT_695253 [Tothia fuscella]|uniref:Uncharacterized protein n=1 Tax=Tothia fuscella TaxID=1048955 RepID=A0A9P4NW86_9PEZI|nr:hypothetical protein EJ08DRAFT_695253 [Tothia fuscella]